MTSRSVLLIVFVGILGLTPLFRTFGQEQPQSQPASPPQNSQETTPLAHVEKRGNGPVSMILIPGLACDWTVFESFMDRNAERYTMYAVTLPGFGGSEPPPKPPADQLGLWLQNAVDAIRDFARETKLEKPVLVGHSMGGHLALRLAIEHPGEFSAIISIDGAPVTPLGGLDPDSVSMADRKTAAREVAALRQSFGANQWNAHQQLRAGTEVKDPQAADRLAQMFVSVPPAVTIQYMADFMSADLRPQLARIVDRTLVIASLPTGDMLPGMEPSARAAWAALVKGASNTKLVFFDHSRHFIQFDRPAELDATIAGFISGVDVKDVITPESADQPQPDDNSTPAATVPDTQPSRP